MRCSRNPDRASAGGHLLIFAPEPVSLVSNRWGQDKLWRGCASDPACLGCLMRCSALFTRARLKTISAGPNVRRGRTGERGQQPR